MDNTNQLSQSKEMIIDYPYSIKYKIRVIRYADRKWHIDPPIEEIRSNWKLWVLVKQPLSILDWEHIDYQCIGPFISNNLNFFQYFVQLGRHVLSDRHDVLPTEFQYWSQ